MPAPFVLAPPRPRRPGRERPGHVSFRSALRVGRGTSNRSVSARRWSCAFHRNAGHVLQAFLRSSTHKPGLAFQEYDAAFPHEKFTLGFAGRPGGPEFYISTVSNVANHGPGSQGSRTEADSCFAKVVAGFDVVKKMQDQPTPGGMGFVNDRADYIVVDDIRLTESRL